MQSGILGANSELNGPENTITFKSICFEKLALTNCKPGLKLVKKMGSRVRNNTQERFAPGFFRLVLTPIMGKTTFGVEMTKRNSSTGNKVDMEIPDEQQENLARKLQRETLIK